MHCSGDGRDAGHIVVRMGEMLMQCSEDGRDAETQCHEDLTNHSAAVQEANLFCVN